MPQVQAKLGTIPGIQMFPAMPPALPGGGTIPGRDGPALDRGAGTDARIREEIQKRREGEQAFFFPPIIDTKIDQPQAEVVIDHDKVAALGLNLPQIGSDLSAMFGGNFVNRFNISGRSYKVIPQIERSRAFEPRPARRTFMSRARTTNWFR